MSIRRYSLVFLFSEDLEQVLLVKKKASSIAYAHQWNGIGGKCNYGESHRDCAVRETMEEACVYIGSDMVYFATMEFYNKVELSIWGARVNPGDVAQVEKDEPQKWFNSLDVIASFTTDFRFAGDGNLPYFIYNTRLLLVKED